MVLILLLSLQYFPTSVNTFVGSLKLLAGKQGKGIILVGNMFTARLISCRKMYAQHSRRKHVICTIDFVSQEVCTTFMSQTCQQGAIHLTTLPILMI